MVKTKEDLTGRSFGRLTVIRQTEDYISPKGIHYAQWLCECSCKEHNQVIVNTWHLKNKHTQSCGCLQKERIGETSKIKNKRHNEYDLSGDYGVGYAHNNNKEFYFDIDDYDKIKDFCWSDSISDGHHTIVARDPENKKIIIMHQLITGKKNMDHANRNSCDNRKSNLREATPSQQIQNHPLRKNNTSGFVGVCWKKSINKWMARISIYGKETTIGYFADKDDAIIARLKAEAKYYKDFAPQWHLFSQYGISVENDD